MRQALLLTCLAFLALAFPVFGSSQFSGYLIDRACAEALKHDSKDIDSKVVHHTTTCALSTDCSEAGYSLYSNGKFIDLDSKGNELAKKYFQTSKRKEGHYVTITGDLKSALIRASDIKETSPPKGD
jgi:hypothetical protein